MWLCCVGAAGFMGWLFLENVFAPLYITEVAHQPATTAGFLLGATGLGSFVLGFLLRDCRTNGAASRSYFLWPRSACSCRSNF